VLRAARASKDASGAANDSRAVGASFRILARSFELQTFVVGASPARRGCASAVLTGSGASNAILGRVAPIESLARFFITLPPFVFRQLHVGIPCS